MPKTKDIPPVALVNEKTPPDVHSHQGALLCKKMNCLMPMDYLRVWLIRGKEI